MVYPFIMPGVSHVGPGALAHLSEELGRLAAKKVLIVCDPGILNAGLVERIEKILSVKEIAYTLFSEVELEPSTDNVEKAGEVARSGDYEAIIGIGGGSSLDVAKGAAILVTNSGRMKDFMGIEQIPNPGLPTVLIPTTAGTGAEITLNAIYALKDEQVKKGVVSRHLRSAVAIVDPELTLSCPPKVTAAAGMDALVHAIESYTAIKATFHTDIYALKAIEMIGRSLRRAVFAGHDLEARADMAYGSFFAGVSLANAGVGAVHALAYPLGGRFHVSHGVSNALLLPYVLELNIVGHVEKFAKVAKALGQPVDGKAPWEAAESALTAIRRLSQDVGIPQRLSEVGVTSDDIEELTNSATGQTRLLSNNPRKLSKEDIKQIYMRAM